MDESASNPYKAPEAAVSEAAGEKLSDVYDRFTAWAVFGLGVITLGIYYIYWMYTRTRRLNPHIEEPISDAFIYTTLVPGLAATFVWFWLVNRIGATRAATFHFLNPFFGVAIAALLLGEPLGRQDLIGVAIITAGILAVQLSRQRNA